MQEKSVPVAERVRAAEESGFRFMETHRRLDASWVGELSSSALATGFSCLAFHLQLDEGLRSRVRPGLEWLTATQREDGGWGDATSDPANMNATAVATSVLQYCAPDDYRGEIYRGRRWVERAGGFATVNNPKAISMSAPARSVYALAGFVDWREVRKLPTEVILLPGRIRRSVSITFSSILSFALLIEHFKPSSSPRRLVRRRAEREAVRWLREALGSDGSYGESAILTSITIAALSLADAGGEDIIRDAIPFVRDNQRPDGSWPMDRDLENFDTTQAVLAHHEAGRPIPEPEKVREWMISGQFDGPCFHTSSPPGGWAWARPAGWPDVDDTPCTIKSLRLLGAPPGHPSIRLGLDWLYEMQNSDGSWPTFVKDSRVPFDKGCPYITSQVLCALAAVGPEEARAEPARRALSYLHESQEEDGSFGSLWFRAHTRGTAAVIEALSDLRVQDQPMLRSAAEWLWSHQNPDGGWGDGHGAESTAEETAWATAALLRLDQGLYSGAAGRGIRWLLENQRGDGGWEAGPVGMYFSSVVYSNTFYAISYPLVALSRYRRSLTAV